jgi:hypothetical protein
MVDFLRANKRCALWASMGLGKSSSMLFALDVMQLCGEIGGAPTLVIGPMRVARDTWPDEVAKWTQFQHLKIMPLCGSPELRARKLRAKADIFTISYELLPWLVSHYMDRWPFRQVVADESDRLKGFRMKQGGMRAHSIGRLAHTLVDRWINLTGTPTPNGLKDLWGQTWYIDRGARLGKSYDAFQKRWFQRRWSGHGIDPLPHADREIHAALADVCLTVDAKDYFDLKDPIVTTVSVKLPPAARKIYDRLEKEMFAELANGAEIEVFNAAALTNKCLQLANGAVYTKYPEWEAVHDEKLQALESIQAESGGMPLLVAYQFKSDLARILKAFPKAVELRTADGMKAFRSGHAPMGLAHPASMGHGIDGLQLVTNTLVYFGHDWNMGQRVQMLERVGPMRQLQAGLERPVLVYNIIAEKTLDADVIEAHAMKRGVQDALLSAMKRRT